MSHTILFYSPLPLSVCALPSEQTLHVHRSLCFSQAMGVYVPLYEHTLKETKTYRIRIAKEIKPVNLRLNLLPNCIKQN